MAESRAQHAADLPPLGGVRVKLQDICTVQEFRRRRGGAADTYLHEYLNQSHRQTGRGFPQ